MSLMIAMCLTLSCKHLVVTEPLHRGPPCKAVYPQAVLEPCDPILRAEAKQSVAVRSLHAHPTADA